MAGQVAGSLRATGAGSIASAVEPLGSAALRGIRIPCPSYVGLPGDRMPMPRVLTAVRRGTAPSNVLDLVVVAGKLAGSGALARHRSRQLARRERVVRPLPVARGSPRHLRQPEVGLSWGLVRGPSRARHRAPLGSLWVPRNRTRIGCARLRAPIRSALLPGIGWLRIALDSPETRCSELAETSSLGWLAFGSQPTALDSPRGARLV